VNKAELVLAICAALTVLGGLFIWLTRVTLEPFKILIQSNTKAMTDIANVVSIHADKIEDHGVRLTAIETKHAVRHGG
jgi:hypothetical protein